ncbi:MAG TPA: hypothetical protein VFI72_12505 [Candidatus Angelobacter sp.]|jgi:hypothetical protein|nr:hypothetical protein [Candidatus Angelobacter sp.]
MTTTFSIHELEAFMVDFKKVIEKHPIAKTAVVASFVSPGVKVDGGGFVIVNGHIHIVPPRGPKDPELNKAKLSVGVAALDLGFLLPEKEKLEVEKFVFETLGMEDVLIKKAIA